VSVLDLLKSPKKEELTDPEEIKKNYKYWRLRTFYGMYIGYIFYYFSRKSFVFAMPGLIHELGFTKTDLGLLGSILSLTYGASKFLSGIISDKSNPRYFMAFGLILTGIFNICFGASSTLWAFALFWGLNGWFQGWGWPPCAKLLTHWYSKSERGRWWSFWNTSHNLGGFLIPLLVAFVTAQWGWRFAMYVPGVICIFAGLFVINRLRDTPQSLGLPAIEKYRNDYAQESEKTEKNQDEEKLSAKKILVDYVLKNKFVWLLAVSYFFIYVIRTAVNDWTLLFLMEDKGYSHGDAGKIISAFEVGGFFGSLISGWASDYIFKAKRGPVNLLFTLFSVLSIYGLWKFSGGHHWLIDASWVFLIGFFIFGPQMLIGIAAAEISHKKAAGTATGFAGCFAYLGAAAAGLPLGWVIHRYGWEGFFWVVGFSGVISLLLLAPLWRDKPVKKQIQVQEKG
jgi:OPA family sugar phosphate sensor protein UhpC-like MFS transporter